MNHGHCKTCWWWQPDLVLLYTGDLEPSHGICWFQSYGDDIERTQSSSWCPDWCNRGKETKESGRTLADWFKDKGNANRTRTNKND